jgi:hypothetical protein
VPRADADERASLDCLVALVRGYVGDDLQWDVQLTLKRQETPPLGLGILGHLGWSTWLLRDPIARDPDDLVLDVMASEKSSETIQYQRIPHWSDATLGQRRDGSLVWARAPSKGPT